jgi:hypothetical protein
LNAVFENSRSDTTLLAWCHGRITRVGGIDAMIESRLTRPRPSTFEVSQTPSFLSVSVPKWIPFATSARVSPSAMPSRARWSSSVICRASISR